MTNLLATAFAYSSLFVLLSAGATHLSHPERLARALSAQKVWARPLIAWVSSLVTLAELLVGTLGLVVVSGSWGNRALPALALVAAGVLFIAFGAYALYLLRKHPSAPCGCSAQEHPANGWVVARAAGLSGTAFAAAAMGHNILPLTALDFRLVLSLTFSLSLAILLWNLPLAMADPANTLSQEGIEA